MPKATWLSASIHYWLEDEIANGCRVVMFSPVNPSRDEFFNLLEIELELPSDAAIRQMMEQEAQAQGLQLSRAELAELQPLAG